MKYSIMVIEESSRYLRSRIISTLTREGFDVTTAVSSQEVVSAPGEFKPQLIILGEGLCTDSCKVCSQLRQAVDALILMVGDVLNDQSWNRVVDAGADFYLQKPFGCQELVARVKALLRRHEWNREMEPGSKE